MAKVIQITSNFKKQHSLSSSKKKAKEEINQTIPPFHGLAKSLSEDNKSVEVAT